MNCKIHVIVLIFSCYIGVDAFGGEPRIAGFDYLIIVDPSVSENGRPSPIVRGGQVEIPPTLHIHPYFYSGDLEFQAPIIEGGPTIIVAKHPRSGEKLYIDAILPPGAPVISYNNRAICYIYTDRRVFIEFVGLRKCKAVVKQIGGHGIQRSIEHKAEKIQTEVRDAKQHSRFYSEVKEITQDTGKILKGSVGVVGTAGAFTLERVRLITGYIPGVKPLMSIGEQAETRQAFEEIRQAGLKQSDEKFEFIPTVR